MMKSPKGPSQLQSLRLALSSRKGSRLKLLDDVSVYSGKSHLSFSDLRPRDDDLREHVDMVPPSKGLPLRQPSGNLNLKNLNLDDGEDDALSFSDLVVNRASAAAASNTSPDTSLEVGDVVEEPHHHHTSTVRENSQLLSHSCPSLSVSVASGSNGNNGNTIHHRKDRQKRRSCVEPTSNTAPAITVTSSTGSASLLTCTNMALTEPPQPQRIKSSRMSFSIHPNPKDTHTHSSGNAKSIPTTKPRTKSKDSASSSSKPRSSVRGRSRRPSTSASTCISVKSMDSHPHSFHDEFAKSALAGETRRRKHSKDRPQDTAMPMADDSARSAPVLPSEARRSKRTTTTTTTKSSRRRSQSRRRSTAHRSRSREPKEPTATTRHSRRSSKQPSRRSNANRSSSLRRKTSTTVSLSNSLQDNHTSHTVESLQLVVDPQGGEARCVTGAFSSVDVNDASGCSSVQRLSSSRRLSCGDSADGGPAAGGGGGYGLPDYLTTNIPTMSSSSAAPKPPPPPASAKFLRATTTTTTSTSSNSSSIPTASGRAYHVRTRSLSKSKKTTTHSSAPRDSDPFNPPLAASAHDSCRF